MTYIVVGFVGMFVLGIFCGIIFNSLCEDRWYIYRTEDRIQIRPYTKNLYLKIVRGEVELIACSSFLITAFIKYSMLKKEL